MAILIEEEKKSINWVSIIAVGIIILLVFIGAYYVFFKDPGVIDQIVPRDLQNVSQLTKTNIDPTEVVNLPTFKLLQDFAAPLSLPSAGRDDPFKPF